MKTFLTIIIIIVITFSSNAQSNFGVGINLGVSVPAGDFDEFYNTGFGGDVHFLYHLGNQAIFTLSVGYNLWNLDVDEFNKKASDAGLSWHFDLDSDFKIIPILIGVKWLLVQSKKGSLYLSLKGGVYNYKFCLKGTANSTDPGANSIPIQLPRIEKTGTETMLALGLGYLIQLGKHWYADVNGNYNIITNGFAVNEPVNPNDSDAIYGVKGTLQYVSFLVGINYRF